MGRVLIGLGVLLIVAGVIVLGLERAGRFGKGRWNEIIRTVDSLQAMRS